MTQSIDTSTQSATPASRRRGRRSSGGRHGRRRGDGAQRAKAPKSALAVRIVQAALRPDVSVAELAELARTDPAFAIRLLCVVNAAASGTTAKIDSVPHAASMLGVSGLRNLALSLMLSDMVAPGDDGEALLGCCLRRSVAMRMLAERCDVGWRIDDFVTAALLLEVGMLAHANDDLGAAVAIARAPAQTRTTQERAAGLVPHTARGALLAREWELSEQMIEAIARHHDAVPPELELARMAWAAERLAAAFEGGSLQDNRKAALQAVEVVGLDEASLEEMLEAMPALVRDAASAINRSVDQQDLEELRHDVERRVAELNQSLLIAICRLERLLAEKEDLTTALLEANGKLEQLATTDGLTRLNNHRVFRQRLEETLHHAAQASEPASLVMFDLDHFKSLNDSHGHPAGDAVLRHVGTILIEEKRGDDVAARYGGEEFVLLLPATGQADALRVANRVRRRLARSDIDVGRCAVRVTASFGVASTSGPDCASGSELVAAADAALYEAKGAGRNRVAAA